MNCRDVLDTLEAVASGALPSSDDAARDAGRHHATCPACQAAWPNRQQWSQQLAEAMQDVPIPAGLRDRLHAACAPPVAPAAVTKPRRSRRWFVGSIAAAVLLALGLVWWLRPLPTVTDKDLLAAMQVEPSSLPQFVGRFDPQLPDLWRRYYELNPQLVRGFPEPSHPATGHVALVPFQFQTLGREQPVRGRLLMLRRDQFVGTALPEGFAATTVYYTRSGGAYALWTEGDLVFVCLVPSGPADLTRFKEFLCQPRPLT
uniref:Zinc-finger domain-containing protein n=1 Tax=Schlesneria paludicola TaxID=360056 RepID=A0A7C2NZ56_9PLAN